MDDSVSALYQCDFCHQQLDRIKAFTNKWEESWVALFCGKCGYDKARVLIQGSDSMGYDDPTVVEKNGCTAVGA